MVKNWPLRWLKRSSIVSEGVKFTRIFDPANNRLKVVDENKDQNKPKDSTLGNASINAKWPRSVVFQNNIHYAILGERLNQIKEMVRKFITFELMKKTNMPKLDKHLQNI